MKAQDVKVGMVVYDKRRKQYNQVLKNIEGFVILKISENQCSRPVAFSNNLRPLTKKEKGDKS